MCDQIFLIENGELVKTVPKHEFRNLEDSMKEKAMVVRLKNGG